MQNKTKTKQKQKQKQQQKKKETLNKYFASESINLVWISLRLINREAVYEKRKLTQIRLCKYNLFNNFKYSL
jgi:hypothetical protein